ncbi:MAG: hypothetical protein ACOX9R_08485 [Armatimonadota bacterium]|jgi:hypothetical protein
MADEWFHDEVIEDIDEFRKHVDTELVAHSSAGEIWVFRRNTPYFIPRTAEGDATRLSPNAAVRPIIEQQWTVVNEDLLGNLVSQIGKRPLDESVDRGWSGRNSCIEAQLLQSLSSDQIEAATRIHDHHMPGWAASDRALDRLRESLPQFSEEDVLIKAATIDRLYYARHLRLIEAVERIVGVMADPPNDPVALVEELAVVRDKDGVSCYWSFASKFAHFFIRPDAIPIYDGWAVHAIRHHFGRLCWTGKTPYRAFADYVFALTELSGVSCSIRELDRYLWLSGMLRAWQSDHSIGISREVRAVFENEESDVQTVLNQLGG